MELIRTRDGLAALDGLRRDGPLVLVPTMGALHDGHLDLARLAGGLGPAVVSVFVNPRQFGPREDFDAYPRDLERDLDLLAAVDPAPAAVFAPSVVQMYPGGVGGASVSPGPRADVLCGARRPGHFAGVLTVVAKLINLVRPGTAVFGRKDAQQCLVIDEMVRDLDIPVALVDAPTRREDGGLALSSRNRYLDADQRRRAACLWRSLDTVRGLVVGGERDVGDLEDQLALHLADADAVDYAEIRTVPDLSHPARLAGRVLLAVAAHVGPARLIDNLVLEVRPDGVTETSLFAPPVPVRKETS